MSDPFRDAQERVRRTVDQFHQLQERKARLVADFLKTELADVRERILEDLFYLLRVEGRYTRMLSSQVERSLGEIRDHRSEVEGLPASSALRGTVAGFFRRLEQQTNEVRILLAQVSEKVEEEQAFVNRSEGRGLFADRFNPEEYTKFLATWTTETEVERRITSLRSDLERLGIEMTATQQAVDPTRPLATSIIVGTGAFVLLATGYALLGVITAIIGIGAFSDYLSKQDFLQQWRKLRRSPSS